MSAQKKFMKQEKSVLIKEAEDCRREVTKVKRVLLLQLDDAVG